MHCPVGHGPGGVRMARSNVFWGVNALRRQPLSQVVARSIGILGMALLFSIGSGLPPYSSYLAFKLGGTLGTQLSNLLLIPYMGRVGAGVVLCALFAGTGLLLRFRPANICYLQQVVRRFVGVGRWERCPVGVPKNGATGASAAPNKRRCESRKTEM